ncbi:SusC/RagA family TonB-linked outer membrane protein [Fibrella aquatilis]|uniref:TonB-dependent receptor n=1 Tax=Fibrella aquatilis TaxID=2817059 RepID=A0A939GCQ2_9BACT|nr:TonB-dependent receptor [Fibrella aquatilis]MBO0934425.1 TonB-dependent receptor [Fibrella aquatilis]
MKNYSIFGQRFWPIPLAILLCISMVCSGVSYATNGPSTRLYTQAVPITGTVTDEQGQPIPGVTIVEKASKKGSVTDANGRYTIDATVGATLVFSSVGFVAQEVVVGSAPTLNVTLREDVNQLAEVVAVGYQTLRKSDVTGAVANVKARELNLSAPTIGQALVGKLAGVQVAQVSGAPYSSTKIRVRGIGSVNASSDPLYVIDGYPAANDVYVNPNDIESIDVLKDAASAAIYGSRASGGVVLITTKRGKEGKGKLEYEYQFGVNQLANKIKLLNASQFAQLVIDGRNNTYRDLTINAGKPWTDALFSDDNATRIAKVGNAGSVSIPTDIYDFANQKLIAPKYNTDWQDELYRSAPMQRHTLQFSGGSNGVRYLLSGGYQNQQGIITATNQQRINLRANIDADMSKKLHVGANFFVTSTNSREVQEGRFNQGPILGALIYPPYFRAYDDKGNLIKNEAASQQPTFGYQTVENPVALARETNIRRQGLRGTYNATATYDIMQGLSVKANLGAQTYNEKYDFYLPTSLSSGNNPPYSPAAIAAARSVAQTLTQLDLLGEFTLNYSRQFGKSGLNALAGYTTQRTTNDVISVSAQGFQNDRVEEITAKGADPSLFTLNTASNGLAGIYGTGKSAWTLLSYLARVAYNYDSRYFLTASIRSDGSSRFGPLNRYGTFPSVSAGWTVSEEPFYRNALGQASSLKLRASWGLTGNNNIGNYNYQQVFNSPGGAVFGNNTISTAFSAGDIRDQRLGWESTAQYNVGVDAGLFNNRLFVIANYYVSQSYNLLFRQPISAISGTSSILTNLRDSKVQNSGFELQLDGRVIARRDLKVNLSGNLSVNRNKVLNLGGASTIITNGAERSYLTHITQEGQPIGMFYGFQVVGLVRQSDVDNIAADNANFNAATQSYPKGYVIKGPPRSTASSNPLKPGDLIFADTNGDGVITDADKGIIGNPYPKFTYGFSASASYKGFDLNAAFNGSYGNQVLDGQDYYLYNMEGSGNQYAVVADRYRSETEPGNGAVYRASRGGTQSNSTRLSTFYLQDGSFLRLANVTVGYSFPGNDLFNRLKVSGLRVYASANNVFTITKYLGYNPEVDYNYNINGNTGTNINGATNLTPGVDYGVYPLAKSYNVGVRVSF